MIVSEIFGPTIQGEGPTSGRPSGFIRLGRCNLTCSWCDTPYTWDWKGQNGQPYDPAAELHDISVDKAVHQLLEMDVPRIVVTGGEPLLHRTDLTELVQRLRPHTTIEIETNGTLAVWPDLADNVNQFNVSIKLANSGVDEPKRIVADAINSFPAKRTIFKFVAKNAEDIEEIEAITGRFTIDNSQIWVMPEGQTMEHLTEHMAELAPLVIAKRWNLTTRLHVQLWGDQRGV